MSQSNGKHKPVLSIVIPVSGKESRLSFLLDDLSRIDENIEIILALEDSFNIDTINHPLLSRKFVKSVSSIRGRAVQQNSGAKSALADTLWFLHADSRLNFSNLLFLREIVSNPEALYYFSLNFDSSKRFFMKITELGVFLRCMIFNLPFGDQGFILNKELFFICGMFDEHVACGEDHLLVRKLKQLQVPIVKIKESITTSSRRYEMSGWFKTTFRHLYLTLRRAY